MADPAPPKPKHLDLDKERALTVYWMDGRVSVYPIEHLRKMSPSADQRELRRQMAQNPLTVLPDTRGDEPLRAESAELVGNYALRLRFSDGHHTGLFSWDYLRRIDPDAAEAESE